MKGDVMPRQKIRPLVTLLASATTAVLAAVAPASAQTPAPGLPMWVIKDADSTIYMTGTVHMLPEGMNWGSEKLSGAIKDAKELWLELPMGSDPMKFAMEAAPVMMKYAMSPGRPLSSLLTQEEKAALDAKLKKAELPPETTMVVNMMKPWFATMLIGISPLTAAGFDPEQGIDVKIAKMAEDDGDPIKGFETVEEQSKILSSGTEEEQLKALRYMLAMTDEATDDATKKSEAAFAAWARGDVSGLDSYMATMAADDGASAGGASMDALLKNRNENWAGQIETMLKGSGTHFIAVGAGHLVGPDSVQERLKLRGIETQRY
jgi:uncharacterized protein